MRTLRLPGGVDFETVVDAFMALQELARKAPRFRENVSSFIEDLADEWDKSLPLLIEHAAAYVERAQRVAVRFESWRASKRINRDTHHGSILEIGDPDRPLRRVRGEGYAKAAIATAVVVRAKDREDGKSRAPRFIATLAQAYEGWSGGVITVLLAYAIRDRRFARRFRSWRRAMAARAAAPPSSPTGRCRSRGQQGAR